MKKIIGIFLTVTLLLQMTACGKQGLQIENATAEQTAAIESILQEQNITVKKCEKIEVNYGEDLDGDMAAFALLLAAAYQSYQITDTEGKEYRITVNAAKGYQLVTVTDAQTNEILYQDNSDLDTVSEAAQTETSESEVTESTTAQTEPQESETTGTEPQESADAETPAAQ